MDKAPKIHELQICQDFLKSVGGEHAIELVKICIDKKRPVKDEEIGKKMPSLKITEIRTVLNRLHYRGIACYQKTKNIKTGWYSYTWEIKEPRIAELIIEQRSEQVEKMQKGLEFEGTHEFYSGGQGMQEYPFEIAAQYDFKDPETGKPLSLIDNKKRLKELTGKIEELKNEMSALEKILDKNANSWTRGCDNQNT
ncbi:Transcription factor E [uncultured archaeon]|nr:Transcription factor E [uncultured archaeon]